MSNKKEHKDIGSSHKGQDLGSSYPNHKIIVLSDLHVGINDYYGKLNCFISLVNHLVDKYKGNSQKPVVVLAGDLVDFSNDTRQNMVILASDVSMEFHDTWYLELTHAVQKLLDEGFTIIPVYGNHDDSGAMSCLRLSEIDNTPYSYPIILGATDTSSGDGSKALEIAQENLQIALSLYAINNCYDTNFVSGVGIGFPTPNRMGYHHPHYGHWVEYEHNWNPNFVNDNQVIQGTKYRFSSPRWLGQQDSTLHVRFQRGYEILTISTIDSFSRQKIPVSVSDGDDGADYILDGSLFTHDGRLRFSQGYVDDNEFIKISNFVQSSNDRYQELQKEFGDHYRRLFKRRQLYILAERLRERLRVVRREDRADDEQIRRLCSEIKKIEERIKEENIPIPPVPRPVRILCMHHQIDYKWTIGLSTHQDFVVKLINQIKEFKQNGTIADKVSVRVFLLENIMRLSGSGMDLGWMIQVIARMGLGLGSVQLIFKYGQRSEMIQFPTVAFPQLGVTTYEWDSDSNSFKNAPMDGILNQQPGLDNNSAYMPGLLNSLQSFDVVIYGHTHYPNYQQTTLPTQAEIDSNLNNPLAQAKTDNEGITEDDIRQFLGAVDIFPGLSDDISNLVLGYFVNRIVGYWKSCDFAPKDVKYFEEHLVKHIINVPATTLFNHETNFTDSATIDPATIFYAELEISNSKKLIEANLFDGNDNKVSWDITALPWSRNIEQVAQENTITRGPPEPDPSV